MADLKFAAANTPTVDANKKRVAVLDATAGRQARERRLAPLVPEFERTRSLVISDDEAGRLTKKLRLPKGASVGDR